MLETPTCMAIYSDVKRRKRVGVFSARRRRKGLSVKESEGWLSLLAKLDVRERRANWGVFFSYLVFHLLAF